MENLDNLAQDIAENISAVAGGRAVLHEPEFRGEEWANVKDCLDTGWVSSVGGYVDRFEEKLGEVTGAGFAIATVNGTAALHACLHLVGVQPGDEVILPALTFAATANAASYSGAIPHFADSDMETLGLDGKKLRRHLERICNMDEDGPYNVETGRPVRAIVCMHAFGLPCNMDELLSVADQFGLPLVEDAAESLGSYYGEAHTGTLGRVGALSFNGNKIITTGGGGAIITNDPELAKRAKHITTTAKLPHAWEFEHDEIGYNYRMPNVNAAIGCAQLDQLSGILDRKRALAMRYRESFKDVPGVSFIEEPANCISNYWLNGLLLEPEAAGLRDKILSETNKAGVMTRPTWKPLHFLEMYKNNPRMDLSATEDLYQRIISIPSSAHLVERDADGVV